MHYSNKEKTKTKKLSRRFIFKFLSNRFNFTPEQYENRKKQSKKHN